MGGGLFEEAGRGLAQGSAGDEGVIDEEEGKICERTPFFPLEGVDRELLAHAVGQGGLGDEDICPF